ncbi:MAG TPA: glycosyltransferase [Acidimicrobiales bacterium]
MRVAAVIPAWNEGETIGQVAEPARRASLVDDVIVVDNGSSDETAVRALAAGARVVHQPIPGKGETMATGVAATDAEVIVFLDADLLGLSAEHVDALVRPVVDGDVDMACGLFDRGPVSNVAYLHALPILTGQRALRRELFEMLSEDDIAGYRVEAALNSLVNHRHLRRYDVVCDGLWHRTKEEKFSSPMAGFLHKQAMLITAIWSYISFAMRHRVVQPLTARS